MRKRPPFGIPREIILLAGRLPTGRELAGRESAGRAVWPYTFRADGSGGGCGKVVLPSDTPVEQVQAAVFASLAETTRTLHDVGIDVVWSSLADDSWVGRIRCAAVEEPGRADG
ncbi:hypothetical protein ABT354_36885 [Streptomyces sp. NPDC000594]|uniref:hypothetical protein n=1 Tax=Streptomyces sp. NPDC000594 TaxID=3154261 RepID=UPI003323ABD9